MSGSSPLCISTPTDWFHGLTEFERRFVEEFMVDLNTRKALGRCGKEYKTAQSAWSVANDLRNKPRVRAAIERMMAERGAAKVKIIEEYAKIAFSNLGDYVKIKKDERGRAYVEVTPTDELTEEQLAALAEVSEVKNDDGSVSIKVKTCDKIGALSYLAKAAKLFTDRQEISGPNGGPIPIETSDARDRLKEFLGLNAPQKSDDAPSEPKE